MNLREEQKGFTLIELLIVIAIILILIAIALPNFLEAQIRAKVTREYTDMRTLATGIESLRTERGFLLVDFWDDDIGFLFTKARFGYPGGTPATFSACCKWHHHDFRGGTTGLFTPLTTPVKYLTAVPPDPFHSDTQDHVALISDDTLSPVSYMYIDRETQDNKYEDREREWRGAHGCWAPDSRGGCNPSIRKFPALRVDSYVLIGFGPDGARGGDGYNTVYSPTNGTQSFGDTLYRSDGGTSMR